MVARVRSVAFQGIDVVEVEAQVVIASGLPAFNVVGLPDKAVAESRERVRAALRSMGLAIPAKRITVNLAPADIQRNTLEALRQPLETGRVSIARANAHITFPSRFQLVCAMNPCKCGYLDDASLACSRAPRCAQYYQSRISGPMFDRIDLHVDVPAVRAADLSLPPPAEGSAQVAARVAAARARQKARFSRLPDDVRIRTNAEADGVPLDQIATPDPEGKRLMVDAAERLHLSARGYHRVLHVARTLADLDASENVRRLHVAEALSYRRVVLEAAAR